MTTKCEMGKRGWMKSDVTYTFCVWLTLFMVGLTLGRGFQKPRKTSIVIFNEILTWDRCGRGGLGIVILAGCPLFVTDLVTLLGPL